MTQELFRALAGAAAQKLCRDGRDPLRLVAPNADLRGLCAAARCFEVVEIDGARLDGASFAYSRIVGGSFADVRGERVDLRYAFLNEVDFREAQLPGARLDYSLSLHGDYRGADLSGASLANTVFMRCGFRGASLRDSDIHDAACLGCDGVELADLGGTALDPMLELEPLPHLQFAILGLELADDWVIGYCPRRARSEYEVTFEVGRTYTAPVFSQSPIYSAFGFSFSGSQLVREHYPDEDDFVRVAANRDNVVLNGEAGEVRCRELVVLSEHRFDRPPARPRRAAATDDDEQIPPYAEMH